MFTLNLLTTLATQLDHDFIMRGLFAYLHYFSCFGYQNEAFSFYFIRIDGMRRSCVLCLVYSVASARFFVSFFVFLVVLFFVTKISSPPPPSPPPPSPFLVFMFLALFGSFV